ncbi:uroporphyrin-III C-methyltransferase [Sulfolobus acidocaldarius SUSAZ]|nr:uroporphyrin-III C-methyltransferase [Sulfolobus acidocaldarius SUSAZ]
MIKIKNVYDKPEISDGIRILIERTWPASVTRGSIDMWLRDLAPSEELIAWYNYEPQKWEEFKRRYLEELRYNPKVKPLLMIVKLTNVVTFLYSGDSEHNNAVVLKEYIESLINKES